VTRALMRAPAAALAALALALLASGCASTNSNTTVGNNLSVYSIMPLEGEHTQVSDDVVDGEKLALQQAGGKVGPLTISFRSVDSAQDGRVTDASAAAAGRTAAQDAGAIAAVGTLGADEARIVLPLTDEARLPVVSAANSYPGLTRAVPGVTATGEPDRLFPSGTDTFARVIGSDVTQAPAIARIARRAGCSRLDVVAGDEPDDVALAALVGQAIPGRTTFGLNDVASAGSGCLLIASREPVEAARAARAAHAKTLIAPAALLDPAFVRAAPDGTRIVSPVPALRDLPPAASRAAAAFRRAFGRPATAWSLLGFDAMQTILDAVRRAGSKGTDRAVVARTLRDGHPRASILGPQAIDAQGDPTSAHWSEASVRAGVVALGDPLS